MKLHCSQTDSSYESVPTKVIDLGGTCASICRYFIALLVFMIGANAVLAQRPDSSLSLPDSSVRQYAVTVTPHFADDSVPDQCEIEVYTFDDKELPVQRVACKTKISLKAGRYDFRVIVSESGYIRERWLNSKLVQGDAEYSTTFAEREASLTILSNVLSANNSFNPLERVVVLLEHSRAMLGSFDEFSLQQRALQFLEELRGHTEARNLPLYIYLYGSGVSETGQCVSRVIPAEHHPNQPIALAINRVPLGDVAAPEDALRALGATLTGKHGNFVLVITSGKTPCGDSLCAGITQIHPYADQFRVVHFDQSHLEDCAQPRLFLGDSHQIETLFNEVKRLSMSTIGMLTIYLPHDHSRPIAYGLLGRRVRVPKGNYDVVIRRGDETISWSNFPIRKDIRAQIDEGSISLLP